MYSLLIQVVSIISEFLHSLYLQSLYGKQNNAEYKNIQVSDLALIIAN